MLVPTAALLRRRDAIEVIGAGLVAKAARQGHRPIAAQLGLPVSTVRGWVRRFGVRAEQHRVSAVTAANRFDAGLAPLEARGSPFVEALDALGPRLVLQSAASNRPGRPGTSSPRSLAG